MSWQQPGGGYGGQQWNPAMQFNGGAQPFYPPGMAPQQQQQFAAHQYQQHAYQQYQQQPYGQQQGGYHQGGYQQQQQQYGHQQQYGQQQRFGGYQQQQYGQQQPQVVVPVPTPAPAPAPAPEPELSASDLSKLQVGGAKKDPIVMPVRTGKAKTLTIGKKPAADAAAAASPAPTPAPAQAPATTEEPAAASAPSAEPSIPASPVTEGEAPAAAAAAAAEKPKPKAAKKAQKEYKRDPRPHINVVFTGHVDAGKSTASGHLLADHNVVDEREMEKLRKAAIDNHREGWEYAYVMDVDDAERAKGKTHETGAGYFETEQRRVTVLDAPGHKAFVPSMIGGATQADIAVLIISSRTGEFESGFEKGGQTREHTTLVRTCGVKQLVCAINKMDDCEWSKERYDEILSKVVPFLRQNGYDEKAKNLMIMPVSGLTGIGLTKPVTTAQCDWYSGPSLLDYLNTVPLLQTRTETDELCVPLVGAFKEDGKTFVYGKIESGSIVVGDELLLLPSKKTVIVDAILVETTEIEKAYVGDNAYVRVKGIEETDVHAGFVLTSKPTTLKPVEYVMARVVLLDQVRNIMSAGSKAVMHLHAATEEVMFHALLAKVDKKTSEPIEKSPAFAKAGDCIMARLEFSTPIVACPHKDFDKLGRFMLRDDGKTIAIGLIEKLYESTKETIVRRTA